MDNNRPNNSARKGGKLQTASRSAEVGDENKQPHQSVNKNGVRSGGAAVEKGKKSTLSETSSATAAAVVPLKGAQATAEQLRMAQMSQVSSASDNLLSDLVKQVRELTGCSEDNAVTALHDTGNDPDSAVNLILEGGANQSEWETTGKKGKKKPKAKPEEPSENNAGESQQFGGYVTSSRINNSSNRGRQPQRTTSNRGGRGGGAPSAPRASQQEDSNFDGGNHQRTFPPPGDRPASPKGGRHVHEDGRGAAEGKKPDHERLWNEDVDDDWKESIRETKVFTRSAPTQPAPVSNSSFPQQGPGRAPQPVAPSAQSGQSVGASGGPSFSAMVQKQSQQSAGWTNSNLGPPPVGAQQQRLPPVTGGDASSWKQQQQAPSTAPSQKPPANILPSEHVPSVGGSAAPVQHSTIPSGVQKDSGNDAAQLGLQFGNLSFNNSRTTYDNRTEPANQGALPSQTQTFNSRTSFGQHSRDVNSGEQTTVHRPTPTAGEALRQNTTSVGTSPFAPPSQNLSYNHAEQDSHPTTYSAKNIQSSAVFTGTQQQQQQQLPSRSPIGAGGGFNDPRSPTSGQGILPLPTTAAPSVTSHQDSRFTQQQSSGGNVPLAKSPQIPSATASSFGQQQQQPVKPQLGLNQPAAAAVPDQQQYSSGSLQQPAASRQQPASAGGYGSYGLSDSASRNSNSNTYSAFSSQAVAAPGGQKDSGIAGLQQHQALQQQTTNLSGGAGSTPVNASSRVSTTASAPFNAGSRPSAIPATSLGYKQSTYPSQPNPSVQSMLGQQQQYLQQSQQQYGQSTLPMFSQMYTGLDGGMTDPRLQSGMQQPGMGLEYTSYQNALPSRDQGALGGYSTADPSKYRSDPMSAAQNQVSPHLTGPYQSYLYSPTAVPQTYGYAPNPVYSGNIPSAYGKTAGGSLTSNYPSSYGGGQDMSSLADVNKVSNVYNASGLRGFTDGYGLGNQGVLAGSDLTGSSYYGNKAANKFDKPAQNFGGMNLPGGHQTTASYGGQYYTNMMPQQPQQQQLHQMGGGGQLPQHGGGVAGQQGGLSGGKPQQQQQQQQQNKGSNLSYGQNNWGAGGHQ